MQICPEVKQGKELLYSLCCWLPDSHANGNLGFAVSCQHKQGISFSKKETETKNESRSYSLHNNCNKQYYSFVIFVSVDDSQIFLIKHGAYIPRQESEKQSS